MSRKTDKTPVPRKVRAPARECVDGPLRRQEAEPQEQPRPAGAAGCRRPKDPLGDFSEQTGALFG